MVSKKINGKTECIIQILFNENTVYGGNDHQNRVNRNTYDDHTKYGKNNIDDIQKPN